MDQYTFCEALGPEEGNAVLRAHWNSWYTETQFEEMAAREIEIVRLPIGDWTLKPYGPYVGCTEGADDAIQWFLDTAAKYNIKVLLDVHAVRGSQNGFDNSGLANQTHWIDENNFSHWPTAYGEWMGKYIDNCQYESINMDNIAFALDTVDGLLERWGQHPAVYALEPVNEPWWCSDLDVLKNFYRDVRSHIQAVNPDIKAVFHDSFHWDAAEWNDLFADDDIENVVIDTHQYLAWWGVDGDFPISGFCDGYGSNMAIAHDVKYDVWVGEWSLATDVCALWLGGFNDNNTPYSAPCEWVECPTSYFNEEDQHLATDFDRTAAELGPFGSNHLSVVKSGMCPIDSTNYSFDEVMNLGQCMTDIFQDTVQGQFLWTFRNELEDKWSYKNAYDLGWIKKNNTTEFTQ